MGLVGTLDFLEGRKVTEGGVPSMAFSVCIWKILIWKKKK